jgi:predicted acylesterase/phospholipase RssA
MSKKAQESGNVRRAENILRGKAATPQEIWDLARFLKTGEREFGYARRLLARARQDPAVNKDAALRTKLRQQHALCTYKDPDLSDEVRFDRAIEILGDCDDLRKTNDQETLGIAGAIYKNKWQAFGQTADLETSLGYYRRGYEQGIKPDHAYTAINAAFLYDLTSDHETAKRIRREIVAAAPALLAEEPELKNNWWFHVTVAEAWFGLGEYQQAKPALAAAAALAETGAVAKWEFETTARQLASLARLEMHRSETGQPWLDSEPWQVLESFLGKDAPGVWTAFLGKVGLALSGGGFRASLFHIGVLAKLAEMDVLRHVEALSCVSGGSIVGAHYYLKVRKLLHSKNQDQICRKDFVDLVSELEKEFLEGIRQDIRTQVIGSFWANLKMAFSSHYSRTQRVGELYEKYLYEKADKDIKDFSLNKLIIEPRGEEGKKFRPKYDNWRRKVKVPILVLNATALNTGHNWQFTATWMGEPPGDEKAEIDANYRLRRMYYDEAPAKYRNIPLGWAVAASACVPGLFDPLTFPELYPNITVRLVDGGVHDNQGTAALLDQSCNLLLVSDASGHMGEENVPSGNPIGVLFRSDSVLQARVRLAQFEDLESRERSSLLKGLMFVHLKKDLDADPVDWTNCEDPVNSSDDARPVSRRGELTSYGIRKEIQRLLASIRTDLDCFNEVEAYALMLSGYRMTEAEFPQKLGWFPISSKANPGWRFLQVSSVMESRRDDEDAYNEFKSLLEIAKNSAFKIWKLVPALKVTAKVVTIAAFVAAISACFSWPDFIVGVPLNWVGAILVSAAVSIIAGKVFGPRVARLLDTWGSPRRIETQILRMAAFIVLAFVGTVVAFIHIQFFNRWYLHRGRLDRIIRRMAPPRKENSQSG